MLFWGGERGAEFLVLFVKNWHLTVMKCVAEASNISWANFLLIVRVKDPKVILKLCFVFSVDYILKKKSWKRLLGTNCHPWSWFHNFQMPVFNKQDQKLPLTTRRLAHNIFDVFATSVDKIEEESLQIWKLCFIFSVDYVLKDEAEKERLHIKWTPKSFPQR